MLSFLWDFLFPHHCPGCEAYVEKQGQWCSDCIEKMLQVHRLPVELEMQQLITGGVWALGVYEGKLRDLIRNYKYNGKAHLLQGLHSFIEQGLDQLKLQGDMAVPVPLYKDKLKQRGFNQSERLFRQPFANMKIPMAEALERSRNTKPQYGLQARERQDNLKNAFQLNRSCDVQAVQGKEIILVDDIMTTGATLHFCSEALQKAGAKKITAVVIASGRK